MDLSQMAMDMHIYIYIYIYIYIFVYTLLACNPLHQIMWPTAKVHQHLTTPLRHLTAPYDTLRHLGHLYGTFMTPCKALRHLTAPLQLLRDTLRHLTALYGTWRHFTVRGGTLRHLGRSRVVGQAIDRRCISDLWMIGYGLKMDVR